MIMEIMPTKEQEYMDWKEKNSKDPYSAAVFIYAEKWADLMEKEISNKKRISEIAEKCSNDADEDGITGFMYGCAVSILSECWIHGEELRRWHNKEHGHDGDGVVNPAIISI